MFSNGFGPVPEKGSVEFKNMEKMVEFLYGFASRGSEQCQTMGWAPIQKTDLPHNYAAMKMQDPEWRVGKVEMVERFKVWDSLFCKGELY